VRKFADRGLALTPPLRVALFSDSFHEANGVATVSREFAAFAQRQDLPFFCVHSGARTQVTHQQSLTTLELKRSPASIRVDHGLYCDPLLSRYRNFVIAQLRPFHADLVHITGPGDMGILGFWVAHCLGIPLVASWHTNLHEYAGSRLHKLLSFLPDHWRQRISRTAERQSLRACVSFYGLARFLFAPNQTMVDLLAQRTRKPAFLMAHGVDAEVYSPARRRRRTSSFCIGYVGRLTPEKDVRLLVELEKSLIAAGQRDFRFVVVGEGGEREWLRKNLQSAEFLGILHGDALAEAFASMDVFVFPSRTDTFGLVLLEAMASGVPVVVRPEAGARVGVRHGITGFHAEDLTAFTQGVLHLMNSEAVHGEMSCAAREFACSETWCGVFEHLYQKYEMVLDEMGLTLGVGRPAKADEHVPQESGIAHDDHAARSAALD
jgi:phosphatidylinositol alpha 1,6-mannosyltransferase